MENLIGKSFLVDDTTFIYSYITWLDNKSAMEDDLLRLRLWVSTNQMVLSPGKTNFINFSLQNIDDSFQIKFYKYLIFLNSQSNVL